MPSMMFNIHSSILQLMEVDNDEEIYSALSDPSFESRTTIDCLPAIVSTNNRDEFINLYCRHSLLLLRKPYLDQLITGLNHNGVSTTMNVCSMPFTAR